mgnify:CR=1 FL=1
MNTERLLLDTHVWLQLASGASEKLKPATRKVLERASISSPFLVSIISVWEIALLESRKRLRLSPTGGDRPSRERGARHP